MRVAIFQLYFTHSENVMLGVQTQSHVPLPWDVCQWIAPARRVNGTTENTWVWTREQGYKQYLWIINQTQWPIKQTDAVNLGQGDMLILSQ